ncbi:hypothetical protein [Maritimibacter alkaliphilus]|uniref:hypothetical protein n=1 Tax=Maritimibacter alkaliphilus TaxID=404236 RepID=UPI001C939091|nr:hypothetical protein [Maritimibacter alkaliphilus]MBY6092510.1 hypothetical protein [Maritimibacter alkaliphilus]
MTLLEVAIAILILAVGSIAALRVVDQSRREIGGQWPRVLSEIAARNRAEELVLHGTAGPRLPEEVEMGGLRFAVTTERQATEGGLIEARVTARSQTGEGSSVLIYLLPGFGR